LPRSFYNRLMRALPLILCFATLAASQSLDADRDFWNKKFNDAKTDFNHRPNKLLISAIRDRQLGAAIDLGMGQGRNAVFLAQQGWRVTGVDLSNVAVEQARSQASRLGIKLDTVVADLSRYDLGQGRWDLIAMFYVHAWYHAAKPDCVRRLHRALKPGGVIVIEGFAGEDSFMFQPNELLRDFADLRTLRYEDVQDEADWAPGDKSHIIRLVAEKTE
jgi:SAM-dependent methyltransferase